MCPIYEIRMRNPEGVVEVTRMWGGQDMILMIENLIKKGYKILACETI